MNGLARRTLAVLLLLALIIPQAGCVENTDFWSAGGAWQGVSRTGFYLDTVCTVTIYGMEGGGAAGAAPETDEEAEAARVTEETAGGLIDEAFEVCGHYEALLSKTVAGSDIDRINRAGGEPVSVSADTLAVIQKGIAFGDLSGGAFDITIGTASALWDFHQAEAAAGDAGDGASTSGEAGTRSEDAQDAQGAADGDALPAGGDADEAGGGSEDASAGGVLPDPKALAAAMAHVDYRRIVIDEAASTVQLTDPEARIDLGGIAKGYIADRLADFLAERGVTSAIIDLGGNIVALGGKAERLDASAAARAEADENPFVIGVRDPQDPHGTLLGTLSCADRAIVTSGTYERYVEKDGVRYHHILDTDTGWPVDTDIESATVIAPLGMSAEADALSTTLLALGSDEALALLESEEAVEAILVTADGDVIETAPGLLHRT